MLRDIINLAFGKKTAEIVWLYFEKGESTAEIADWFEMDPSSVKQTIYRARRRLLENNLFPVHWQNRGTRFRSHGTLHKRLRTRDRRD